MKQSGQSLRPDNLQAVLDSANNAGRLGTQQYLTPPELAAALALMLPPKRERLSAVDLTCGNGHLLATTGAGYLYGVDIDPAAVRNRIAGDRNQRWSVHSADITLLYPLLAECQAQFDLFALNPPFSLNWHTERLTALNDSLLDAVRESFPSRPTIDSTLATLLIALDRCTIYGEGYMLCNESTAIRLFGSPASPSSPVMRHVWLWVSLPEGSFPGANFKPCVLYFAADHRGEKPYHHEIQGSDFVSIATSLRSLSLRRSAIRKGLALYNDANRSMNADNRWRLAMGEYRVQHSEKAGHQNYNIWMEGGHIRTHLTPFQAQSTRIPKPDALALHTLNNQSPFALVMQKATRSALQRAVTGTLWRVSPDVLAAMEKAMVSFHQARAPLYPLNAVKRLGWLDEKDTIHCSKDFIWVETIEQKPEPFEHHCETQIRERFSALIDECYCEGVSRTGINLLRHLRQTCLNCNPPLTKQEFDEFVEAYGNLGCLPDHIADAALTICRITCRTAERHIAQLPSTSGGESLCGYDTADYNQAERRYENIRNFNNPDEARAWIFEVRKPEPKTVQHSSFTAGKHYVISTATRAIQRPATRTNAVTGETESVTNHGQELVISITGEDGVHEFGDFTDEEKQKAELARKVKIHSLTALVQHFTIPEVPDVSIVHAEKYQPALAWLDSFAEKFTTPQNPPAKCPQPDAQPATILPSINGSVRYFESSSRLAQQPYPDAPWFCFEDKKQDWSEAKTDLRWTDCEDVGPFTTEDEARTWVHGASPVPPPSSYNSQPETVRSFKFRGWKHTQREDLARASVFGGCVLGWEPGLGKTVALLVFGLLNGAKRHLLVAPEGLHDQIIADAMDLFGISVSRLSSQAAFLADPSLQQWQRDHLAGRDSSISGFWITSYTQLGYNGGDEWEPKEDATGEIVVSKKILKERHGIPGWNPKLHDEAIGEEKNGIRCICRPSLATLAMHCFDYVGCDEAVRLKSDESYISLGVRRLKPAKARLVLTGTPIKNHLDDFFWLAQWAAGGCAEATARFPYAGTNADKEKFAKEFMIIQENHSQTAKKGRTIKKRIPELCNIHRLWKFTGPLVIRRRKRDAGDIVPKTIVPLVIRPGKAQLAVYQFHLANPPQWSKDGAPLNPVAQIGAQLTNLRLAALCPNSPLLSNRATCTLPNTQPDPKNTARSWTDWTPKIAAVLAKIAELIAIGEQVVVMAPFQDFGRTLQKRLIEAGVSSILLDGDTAASKRGIHAAEFKRGKYSVLIGGQKSMGEGYSFECASNLILPSIDWALDINLQSEDRVHRCNSPKPVTIFCMVTENTIDVRLEHLYREKGDAAALALDGEISEITVSQISIADLLREAISNFDPTAPCTDEQQIEDEWNQSLKKRLSIAQAGFNQWHPPIATSADGTRTTRREIQRSFASLDLPSRDEPQPPQPAAPLPPPPLPEHPLKGVPDSTLVLLTSMPEGTDFNPLREAFQRYATNYPGTRWNKLWSGFYSQWSQPTPTPAPTPKPAKKPGDKIFDLLAELRNYKGE
jgi:hypothetical protein